MMNNIGRKIVGERYCRWVGCCKVPRFVIVTRAILVRGDFGEGEIMEYRRRLSAASRYSGSV
jgi:hypothetical protein